jgi:hypothetical protein
VEVSRMIDMSIAVVGQGVGIGVGIGVGGSVGHNPHICGHKSCTSSSLQLSALNASH